MDNIICVYRTDNPTRADLIKSHFESEGITTYIKSNDACGTLPHLRLLHAIEIMISEKDLKLAKAILAEREKNS